MAAGFVGGCLLPLLACGPFFPNSLLLSEDDAVLQAPAVDFRRELDRLQLPAPPRLAHVPSSGETARSTTVDAELSDLRRALAGEGRTPEDVAALALAYSSRRADLEEHLAAVRQWTWHTENAAQQRGMVDAIEPGSRPTLDMQPLPPGVPGEFALYLEGATAWHDGRPEGARKAWGAVLALPEGERRYKSVWAAFMLGRSWHEEDPAKASALYDEAVRLARAQFADSAGLGVAALGWKAQLCLRTNDLKGALGLYLDQYAAGSTQSAALSLTVAARAVAHGSSPEERVRVARDPVYRRVVTAWLLSNGGRTSAGDWETQDAERGQQDPWQLALEEVGASEVPLAEQLAVLSYQSGDWDRARRWIDLSGDSPVADWIQAKLLLRDGKLDEAARVLSGVVAALPLNPPDLLPGQPPAFAESLYSPASDYDIIPGRQQALGELGMLRLTRGEFVQALDALLRAGFWQDAAYVAERVLTVDELRAYVDQQWSPKAARGEATEEVREGEAGCGGADGAVEPAQSEAVQRESIRHLLARRLTRLHRGSQAEPYYPGEWREAHRTFLALLRGGEDESRPAVERARSWMAAAWMARTNGMELMGTELAPDGALWDGAYEFGPDVASREASKAGLLRPAAAELARARAHAPEPDERFHYRYQAAALAWEAASLLPNNDPATALALYHGGSWLKARDPKTADVFYKALVRRCRKTELGDAADRQRWFPSLDAEGHPVVTRAQPPTTPAPKPEGESAEPAVETQESGMPGADADADADADANAEIAPQAGPAPEPDLPRDPAP